MALRLIGRRSSVFTRIPLIFAEHLAVPCEFEPVPDMTVIDAQAYGGNPALKLPILMIDGAPLFGAANLCRAIAERAGPHRVVWPEALVDATSRNAHELVSHCLAAQVQLVMGTVISRLPADDAFFVKLRTGLEGSLAWLDANLAAVLAPLPPERDLSLFETSLFCLVEHLRFRPTVAIDRHERLVAFATRFGQLPAAARTAYRFDV